MTTPIDLAHLNQYVVGDRALLDEILTIFIEQAEQLSRLLSATPPGEDWHAAAHKLKGASRGVGAWRVGDLAESAEALADGSAAQRMSAAREIADAVAAAVAFARDVRDADRH